ncbi:MAG: oligosaccharide flippase family protein [Caulobacterales bacterium]
MSIAPPPSARGAVRQAFFWNAANFGVNQLLSAVVFIVLSNRLDPVILGIFAFSLIFIDFWAVQAKSAATDAIVQRQDFSHSTLSTLFWAHLSATCLIIGALVALAPLLTSALGHPEAADVMRALTLALIFTPILAVGEAIVMKDLGFRTLAIRNLFSVIFGGAAGIAVVFSPHAEWALVAQRVLGVGAAALLIWASTRFVPALCFDRGLVRLYWRSFLALWGAQSLGVAISRIGDFLIGLRIGPGTLGILQVARRFPDMLQGPVTQPISMMWIPMLARIGNDEAERISFFKQLIGLAALVCLPTFMGLALIAPELTRLVLNTNYTDQNIAMVVIVLCSIGLFSPIISHRSSVMVSRGKNRLNLILTLWDLAVSAITVFVFSQYGLVEVLIAWTIATAVLTTPPSVYFMLRAVGINFLEFLREIYPAYGAAIVMILTVLLARLLLNSIGDFPRMLIMMLVGAATYTMWIWIFHRSWAQLRVRLLLRR